MLVNQKSKDILMNTMYGDISQQLRVPDAMTTGSTPKQTYRDPKFKPPVTWYLAFVHVPSSEEENPVYDFSQARELTVVPRLAIPNNTANFAISTVAVSNVNDLTWEPALADGGSTLNDAATHVYFYDMDRDPHTTGPTRGTPWEAIQLPGMLYFSKGQRVTVNAGALTIVVEAQQ